MESLLFQAGTTAALGGIKNARAMDSIIHKARQLIVEVSNSVGELPAEVLAQEYDLNGFRNHVQGVLTGSVVHIQKTNVKEFTNDIGSFIASKVVDHITTEKEKVQQAGATEGAHEAKSYRNKNKPGQNPDKKVKPWNNPDEHAAPWIDPDKHKTSYTAKPGDTLTKIAKKLDTTVEALKKANPQVQNPDRIYAGQTLNLPGETSSQGYTNHHSTGEYGPPLPPSTKQETPVEIRFYDEEIGPKMLSTELSREQLLAYLHSAEIIPDNTETSGTNPRIQKQMDDWVKEFTAALEKSEDANIVIKQHNQYYIFDKNMLKGTIILGKEKFAQAFPNAYEQMASWEDAASGFVAGVVDKADKGIHRVFGEGYENSKKWIGNFLSEANDYAPEIARDGVLLFGGSAAATKIFGKVGKVDNNHDNHKYEQPIKEYDKFHELKTREEARKIYDGQLGEATNKFFKGATSKGKDYKIFENKDGTKTLEFTSPSNKPGYNKKYIQVIDNKGVILEEFKDTIGPDGLINRKYIHGGLNANYKK